MVPEGVYKRGELEALPRFNLDEIFNQRLDGHNGGRDLLARICEQEGDLQLFLF